MIIIRDTLHRSTGGALAEAIRIAEYYGFVPFDSLVTPEKTLKLPTISEVENSLHFARKSERALLPTARTLFANSSLDSPLLVWRILDNTGVIPTTSFELHCVGSDAPIVEPMLLVVTQAIARSIGINQHILKVNNIGTHESSGRFLRDVSNFLRKHGNTISPSLRQNITSDPIGTLVQLLERGHPGIVRIPQATEYLNDDDRQHFWHFLEYLEEFGIQYELSGNILGSRDVWCRTLIELSMRNPRTDSVTPFAFGGHYDPIISRFAKRHTHVSMIGMTFENKGTIKYRNVSPETPSIYFAHIGDDAKKRALMTIETLRSSGIFVHHNLLKNKISEQMNEAKKRAVKHIIIIGHKEVVDGTIAVHNVSSNSHNVVNTSELISFLHKNKIAHISPSRDIPTSKKKINIKPKKHVVKSSKSNQSRHNRIPPSARAQARPSLK